MTIRTTPPQNGLPWQGPYPNQECEVAQVQITLQNKLSPPPPPTPHPPHPTPPLPPPPTPRLNGSLSGSGAGRGSGSEALKAWTNPAFPSLDPDYKMDPVVVSNRSWWTCWNQDPKNMGSREVP